MKEAPESSTQLLLAIIYMQIACSVVCLIQDSLIFSALKDINSVLDRAAFPFGYYSFFFFIPLDVLSIIFNGYVVTMLQEIWLQTPRRWDRIIFYVESALWSIYGILKIVSWNGKVVVTLMFLGLFAPQDMMLYMGTVIFGVVNSSLYVVCFTLGGPGWAIPRKKPADPLDYYYRA